MQPPQKNGWLILQMTSAFVDPLRGQSHTSKGHLPTDWLLESGEKPHVSW